ncbi:hypothetical protein KBD68_02505 [Candidatus Woesebacteria bacterium]|nr:hypothetical protein [Candidatus Woesebacteria bacterium]
MSVKTVIKRAHITGKAYEAVDIQTGEVYNHLTKEFMQYQVSFRVPKLSPDRRFFVFLPEWTAPNKGVHLIVRPTSRESSVALASGDVADKGREVWFTENPLVCQFLAGAPMFIRSFWGTESAAEMRLALSTLASTEMALKTDYSVLTEAFIAQIALRRNSPQYIRARLLNRMPLFEFKNGTVLLGEKKAVKGMEVYLQDPDLFSQELQMRNGSGTFVGCRMILDGKERYFLVSVSNLEFEMW